MKYSKKHQSQYRSTMRSTMRVPRVSGASGLLITTSTRMMRS